MVFESIVVEILNRLLGDYFENLDTSQLRLGIWGGDVVLKDLLLKGSAMDDLDLPFKVVVGKVGSLQMKIPWSSLYTSPVEMSLKDLLLLVTPSYSVKYNEEAEEKATQQGKQKEISRLDEIRARERKRQKEGGEAQQEDTFTEKLVTQIIKNVQIRVESIHIRYEDNVTKQTSPFAFGAVLKSLYVETTNGNWVPSVITEMVETVNKMATLDGLAVYWNSKTLLLQETGDKGEIIKALKDTFTKERANLSYILGPISSVVKILLTPNPERGDKPFSKPKFLVDVVLEELGLGMTNLQFQDIMELIQALDYMKRAQNFRKYRPAVNIHQGHYKEWWRFAYSCVLEEKIRRKRQNWDWHHIVRHRRLVRLYTDAYYKKLTTKKLKAETTQTLSVCEKELDVFNITLVRKQVEVKIEREGKEREENKNKGWFSGFSSYFSKEQSSQSAQGIGEIVRKFEDALTPEEKAKLYKAIDYSENALPLDYPETYLEYKLNFELRKLVFNVSNAKHGNASTRSILRLMVDMLETRIATRPVRNGMQVNVTMKSFNAEGMKGKRDTGTVNIVTSRKRDESVHLLDVHFENNPLNSHVSQKVKVVAQPIEMIYHGKTVINLAKCFALPPEIQLSKLQAAAVATFNEWKEASTAGLQHLLDTRGEIDLHINLLAPYIIIPSEGVYNSNSSNLIVDFGELKVKSLPRKRSLVPGKKEERMIPSLSYGSEEEYIDTMKKHAYDTLVIEFCDFQVMQTLPGESLSLGKSSSLATSASAVPQSLVKSDLLVFHLQQSLVPDDPRFPKLQVEGNLPILNLDLSEFRMIELVRILVTLPLPKPEDTPDGNANPSLVGQPLSTIEEDPEVSESLALIQLTYDTTDKKAELKEEQKLVEFTDMVLKFGIESIRIIISKGSDEAEHIPIMDFELKQIHAKLMAKTFSTSIDVGVGGLTLCALQNKMVNFDGPLYILKTPMTEGIEKHLLNVNMYSISPTCPPQFAGKVKQFITAEISCLDIILHLEAIQKLITFGVKISSILEASAAEKERNSGGDNISISSDTSSLGAGASPSKARTRKMSKQFQKIEAARKAIAKHHNEDDVLLQIDAKLGSLSIQFSSEKQNLMKADLRELDISLLQKPDHTSMLLELKDFGVKNLDEISIYRDIIRVDADKVMAINIILYNEGTKGQNYYNMRKHDISVKVETGSAKIFYFAKQLDELLAYIDGLLSASAKDAVKDATSAAAIAARENVEQAYTSATRILLDVDFSAPVIFVPKNQKSLHCILANLGNLSVKNSFVSQDIKEVSAVAILDKMNIKLKDMRLSHALFDPNAHDAKAEVLMMDTLTLVLTVTRNLSKDWFHDVPGIELDGSFEPTTFSASNEDYDLIMSILEENILYPKEKQVKELQQAYIVEKRNKRRSRQSSTDGGGGGNVPSQSVVRVATGETRIWEELAVKINFPLLGITMFQKGAFQLEKSTGVVKRDFATAFADFQIRNIKLDVKSFNNGDMKCPITIDDIILKDIRPGNRMVTNLIQRQVGDLNNDCPVVQFSFTTETANKRGKTMTLETSSLTIILCLDYLVQLAEFFVRSEATSGAQKKPGKKVTFADDTPEAPKEVVEVDLDEEPLCAFYNFHETELILIESMTSLHSNALLLHCEVALKQQAMAGRSNIMGTVGNVTLSTCNYDPSGIHKSIAEVISPMSITVVLNNSEEVGTLIDINISDIFVRMTAGTLELLLKIFSTIGSAAANQGAGSKDLREEKDYSSIWKVKKNDDMNFWFLNPEGLEVEVGLEALQVQEDKVRLFKVAEDLKVKERLVMESGCIVFTFETGLGNNTMPMLLIEMDMDLQMFDWTTNMSLAGRLKMEAAYYNPTFGLWEYLIEPVESRNHGRVAHQPWELLFELSKRANPNSKEDNGEEGDTPSNSFTSITLESSALLELTVTKTALGVIGILKDDFNATSKQLISEKAISTAAYCIVNDTGADVKILVREKNKSPCFILYRDGVDYEEVILKHGTTVNLGLIEAADMTKHHSSVLREQEGKEERLLCIEIKDYSFRKEIPVNRAAKRYYNIDLKDGLSRIGLVCDIWVKDCSKIVTLRGVLQISNNLQKNVDIYCRQHEGAEKVAEFAGTAVSGEKFNLPLQFTETKSGDLFFAPEGFKPSSEAYSWIVAMKEIQKVAQINCKPKQGDGQHFFFKVTGEAKQALHEATSRKNIVSQCCSILLEPVLTIDNLLPVSIMYCAGEEFIKAEKGESIPVTNMRVGMAGECKIKFKIPDYNNMSWKCDITLEKSTPDISQLTFFAEQDPNITQTLGIHREIDEDDAITLHIYSPYWMINRTGQELIYKGDDKHSPQPIHPSNFGEPILFSFSGKAFHGKKAAQVKVRNGPLGTIGSDWSDKFSLDVAGSSGFVTCKSPICQYQLGVEIQLSSWGLTKYIIFTPRYYIVNQCYFNVYVKEEDKSEHIVDVPPKACIPFWPESSMTHLIARVRADGNFIETKPFRYDMVRHTLLEVGGKYGGLHVDIHYSESKIVITFAEFIPGQAPALIVNATTDCPLEFGEDGCDEMFTLRPRLCQLYTWKKPLGKRVLQWSAARAEKKPQGSDKLFGDGCGAFEVNGNIYFWISFLDGLQRVLLFTENMDLTNHLQAARENEIATSEYIVMLHGIGVSLVDNEKLREIVYLRIASSEISWESSKQAARKRFKPLPPATSKAVEIAYQNYLNQKAIQSNAKTSIALDAGIELDFETMMISKPQPKMLRRVFQTGIWLHYKTLPHSTQFHAKINRLQIDNQLPDTVFRVVFAPVPPSKTVSTTDFPKPFAEISIMERVNAHSYIQQYKYFKILVQEFQLKLDIMFINALVEMFTSTSASKHEQKRLKFTKEYDEACLKMVECLSRQIVAQGRKNFYDFLHFSPLKIHLSFSMGGPTQVKNNFLNLILTSVGVTLTEIQDVVFKLSCMEFQHTFLSGEQLYNEVYSHYSSQAIKQLYILVLGLDVLGNPYGLAVGFASGVEAFFYEPIQGAIQGPGEFAEGLALGVKKFFGGTVGGTAGAFSKITGTLGKGIAALTMDEEFQKKRRENMHNRGDGAERFAQSGKGLVMGFVDGIKGVVTKPVQGAREGGFKGFFKGVGKGTIGLVARPAAGVVDFASGSFDAVKKCATSTIEVHRMRPPRCIPADSVLQPYVKHEAEGVQLLHDIEKGKYFKTDIYVAHALINPNGMFVILLTNKRLFYLRRDELFGGWNVDWTHIWEDFVQPPDLVERGLLFHLKESPKRKGIRLGGASESRDLIIPIYSAEVCTWILSKIEEAMRSETGMMLTEGAEAVDYEF